MQYLHGLSYIILCINCIAHREEHVGGAHPYKKIKILYLITQDHWGGAQQYIYNLALYINKDRFEVYVASGKSINRDKTFEKKLKQKKETTKPHHLHVRTGRA